MHGSSLFVRNINFSVSGNNLLELFSVYGEVKSVKVVQDRGFAFIEMTRQMDAENAMKSLNGIEFQGRVILVNEAHTKKSKRR